MIKFLTGERPLWQAFWLLFIGGYLALTILSTILLFSLYHPDRIKLLAIVLTLIVFGYLILSIISVWNCSKKTKKRIWMWAARTVVILAMIRTIHSVYVLFANVIPEMNKINGGF
jgi:hypothetical protein